MLAEKIQNFYKDMYNDIGFYFVGESSPFRLGSKAHHVTGMFDFTYLRKATEEEINKYFKWAEKKGGFTREVDKMYNISHYYIVSID